MRRNELRALHLPIADELAKRSGSRPRVRPQECEPFAIAGVVPALVFSPRTLAEASKIISTIASEGASIAIRGAGTKAYRPPHPHLVDVVLDTTRCSGVLEHTPADLTVTVEAGTPFALLQQTLLPHGQFFPADPPFAARTTVGGMLSARIAGALRQRYGAPRDSLLGMRVCLSDGSIAFTGSRVVKSVAGYDIPKLFVGAFGTLGLIGEVTLKVAPLPRHERGVVGSFARCKEACDAAQRIACSPLFPLATTLHDRSALRHVRALGGSDAPWTLVIRCGGTRATMERQSDAVATELQSCGATMIETLDTDRLHFAWSDIAELAAGAMYPGDRFVVFSIACVPTQVEAVCAAIAATFNTAQCTAHPASGVVYAHVPVVDASGAFVTERAAFDAGLAALFDLSESQGWVATVIAAPRECAKASATLSPSSPVALWRAVKASFDPSGTFDPGRFVAGI